MTDLDDIKYIAFSTGIICAGSAERPSRMEGSTP